MSIESMIDRQTEELSAAITALPIMTAEQLGLDPRAGTRLYVEEEERAIYCRKSLLRALDYYGGFEYVKEGEGRTTLADFVRFDGYESERVQECFDFLNDTEE